MVEPAVTEVYTANGAEVIKAESKLKEVKFKKGKWAMSEDFLNMRIPSDVITITPEATVVVNPQDSRGDLLYIGKIQQIKLTLDVVTREEQVLIYLHNATNWVHGWQIREAYGQEIIDYTIKASGDPVEKPIYTLSEL